MVMLREIVSRSLFQVMVTLCPLTKGNCLREEKCHFKQKELPIPKCGHYFFLSVTKLADKKSVPVTSAHSE